MKVLVITNLFPNAKEPQRATFNFQQLSELSRLCELKVIAPISWIQKLNNIIKFKKFSRYDIGKSNITAFYPTFFYTPGIFRCLYGVFYFISIFYKTVSLLIKDKPSVLFGTWAYPDGFATVLYGRIFRIPLVIKIHGTDIHSMDSNCRRKLTSWVLNNADKVISVSQSLADTMTDEFAVDSTHIEVIKNGVNTDVFYPIEKAVAKTKVNLNDTTAKIILFIGNLKVEKNPILLLDAFHKLITELTSSEIIHLHYIGSGPLYSELLTRVSDLMLNERVFVHGNIGHEKIPLWLNAADILVLPSNNEGMPNVVLEALACHTPIVATKVGGIPEIIDEGLTGFMISQLNVSSLAKKLSIAINSDWKTLDFVAYSNIHSWNKTANEIMNVLVKAQS